MRSAVVVLSLVVPFGCTVERSVYNLVPDACEQALLTGVDGAACDFAGGCNRPDPLDSQCQDTMTCVAMHLVLTRTCMTACGDDTACTFGTEICSSNVCEPCPPTGDCVACPAGLVPLERNGCASCDCGPPSSCAVGGASACSLDDTCYVGADCLPGCADGDEGCCSNQCAAKGCKLPIPTGCLVSCGTQTQTACNGACITNHCDCVSGAWQCTSICSHGAQSSCVGP